MCEICDLGITWPQWHSVMFEGKVAVDMRVVCPQDFFYYTSEASQDGSLEEMGIKARV